VSNDTRELERAHEAILALVLPAIQQAAERAGLSRPDVLAEELLCLLSQDTTALDAYPAVTVATESDLTEEAVREFFRERRETYRPGAMFDQWEAQLSDPSLRRPNWPLAFPEGLPEEEQDFIFYNWLSLALAAYWSYEELGRGLLVVSVPSNAISRPGSMIDIVYMPVTEAPPGVYGPGGVKDLMEGYDPERQIVIGFVGRPEDIHLCTVTATDDDHEPAVLAEFLSDSLDDITREGFRFIFKNKLPATG